MYTFQDRLAAVHFRPSGFDYMRLVLAVGVIAWHSVGTSYGIQYTYKLEDSWARPLVMVILPMFFSLSGFLVAGSLYRNPAKSTFIGLRAIRIFPALTVEVVLSSWVLGPMLTTFPLRDYFASPRFLRYQANILGHIHYYLPGVFEHNPIGGIVNGQLWTVPWELWCYTTLLGLAIFRIVHHPRAFLALLMIATFAVFAVFLPPTIANGFAHSHIDGSILILAFLSAICLYKFKESIPWNGWIAAVCCAVLIGLFMIKGGDYLCGFPAAYLTVYLGLLNPRKFAVLRGADYSYGIYLYGYAIQQTVAQLGPWARHWYVNLPLALAGATVFSAFSWHVVEENALKLRRYLPMIERQFSRVGSTISRKVRHQW